MKYIVGETIAVRTEFTKTVNVMLITISIASNLTCNARTKSTLLRPHQNNHH